MVNWHTVRVSGEVLVAFVLAVTLMAATPGPAMVLILQRAGLSGFKKAIPTVLGVELGLLFWAVVAGSGMAALVAASEVAFWTLKIVGAGFLVYLGIRAIIRGRKAQVGLSDVRVSARTNSWSFTHALGIQLANPKAALLVLALYPQFIPSGGPVFVWSLGLGVVQVFVETTLYLSLAATAGAFSSWFQRQAVKANFEYLSGSVLVLLGVRTALATR